MDESYIKLFRIAMDSQEFQDMADWKIFTWCLMRAAYKKRWWKGIQLDVGEFITSMRSASTELCMHHTTIAAHLDRLENMGSIKIEATSRYTKITVVNFKKWQGSNNSAFGYSEHKTEHQPEHQPEHQSEPNKNIKNIAKAIDEKRKEVASAPLLSWEELNAQEDDNYDV